ncbi:MAG: hypothetical protein ACKVOE_10315, partial [Rickettsiales bacterium]
ALSRDHPIDGKIDTQTPALLLTDAVEQAQREGKTRMTIMLRFPNTHSNGQRFNRIHGVKNVGNCVEIPVVIDVTPESIEVWKAHKLRTPINGNGNGKHVAADGAANPQEYGFADARAMQNSRPLALNNYWLNLNESRQKSQVALMAERQKERANLLKEIANERKGIKELEDSIAKPFPSEEELAETQEKIAEAESDIGRLFQNKYYKLGEKALVDVLFPEISSDAEHPEHEDLRQLKRDIHTETLKCNRKIGPLQKKRIALREKTLEKIEAQKDKWRIVVGYKQQKIERLETLLEQCDTQIAELGNEPPKHVYAATDRNPNLMSLTVVAANRDAVIHEISEASARGEPIDGRAKSVQPLYKALYDRVLDDSPNGWLADALDSKRPENYYLRSTRRYFDHMYQEAKKHGAKHQNFSEFLADPESSLGEAISKLRDHAVSAEARVADGKSARARA